MARTAQWRAFVASTHPHSRGHISSLHRVDNWRPLLCTSPPAPHHPQACFPEIGQVVKDRFHHHHRPATSTSIGPGTYTHPTHQHSHLAISPRPGRTTSPSFASPRHSRAARMATRAAKSGGQHNLASMAKQPFGGDCEQAPATRSPTPSPIAFPHNCCVPCMCMKHVDRRCSPRSFRLRACGRRAPKGHRLLRLDVEAQERVLVVPES